MIEIIALVAFVAVLYLLVDQVKKLYESNKETQSKYFESLEKIAYRSNQLIKEQNKEFLRTFKEIFKKDIKSEVPKEIEGVENEIEVEQQEEIALADSDRIPIVEGVNIKFEDERETFPININPIENFNDKTNPIEK